MTKFTRCLINFSLTLIIFQTRSSDLADHFWIGLYNAELINDNSTICDCANAGCERCRNMFVWVDEGIGPGFVAWNNDEPANKEKCVRITNKAYAGIACTHKIGYICYRGNT